MGNPLLSIVTVTWNCVATLEKTLQSVQTVKLPSMEYLIIDGASTDGTLALIEKFNPIVDQLISEPDSGIYNAMNKAIAIAKGQYILFINGDDELMPSGFPDILKRLELGNTDIICGTTLVGDKTQPEEILVAQPRRLPFFNTISHPSTFVRTALLKSQPFNEDLRIAADYDFFLRAFLSHTRFEITPAVIALHHRGGASGDQALSSLEVKQIRLRQLGWKYPLVNMAGAVYRALKTLFS